MKFLDMPEGNGSSSIYEQFMQQVERDRSVAAIVVLDENAKGYKMWMYSGTRKTEILTQEEAIKHSLRLVSRARRGAERRGYHPIDLHTSSLV